MYDICLQSSYTTRLHNSDLGVEPIDCNRVFVTDKALFFESNIGSSNSRSESLGNIV